MALNGFEIFRLVVLEKDRQEDRFGCVAAHAIASPALRRLTPPRAMLPCSYSNARFKMQQARAGSAA
jgi:hypothetical protein